MKHLAHMSYSAPLLPVPLACDSVRTVSSMLDALYDSSSLPGMSHLLLQLENTEHQGLSGRRASRDVDVDWHNPVTASGDTVAVVVVSSTVGA